MSENSGECLNIATICPDCHYFASHLSHLRACTLLSLQSEICVPLSLHADSFSIIAVTKYPNLLAVKQHIFITVLQVRSQVQILLN